MPKRLRHIALLRHVLLEVDVELEVLWVLRVGKQFAVTQRALFCPDFLPVYDDDFFEQPVVLLRSDESTADKYKIFKVCVFF